MASAYDLGDVVKCSAAFTYGGAAVDPTTVTFQIRRMPAHTITTYVYGVDAELVKASTGSYYVNYTPDHVGEWCYRFYSETTYVAAGEKTFRIRDSCFD
jgi:hypothetical protein